MTQHHAPTLPLRVALKLRFNVVDGVALVVRANQTLARDVVDAVDTLRRSGAHMFGIVLNAVDLSKMANHYTYYYSPLYFSELENKG
jgi:Mrp family chromosome partitioning ATPase